MIHMKRTLILMLVAAAAFAQQFDNQERSLNCDSSRTSHRNDSVSHCEMKEFTIPGVRQVTVDSGQNGGVQVKGWSRSEILVRAQIQAWARGGVDPRGMVSQILIQTAGGMVSANGPRFGNDQGWAVSYEIFVPHRTDLNLKAHNGGIAILDVNGNIESSTVNGGLKLERLAGSVRGRTQNGGLSVELGGTRWDGQEFRAETQNGGVKITLPEFYSAQLETGTVNGRVSLDIPLPTGLSSSKEVSVRVGSGGPLVRATTVNGGVVVKRKS